MASPRFAPPRRISGQRRDGTPISRGLGYIDVPILLEPLVRPRNEYRCREYITGLQAYVTLNEWPNWAVPVTHEVVLSMVRGLGSYHTVGLAVHDDTPGCIFLVHMPSEADELSRLEAERRKAEDKLRARKDQEAKLRRQEYERPMPDPLSNRRDGRAEQ